MEEDKVIKAIIKGQNLYKEQKELPIAWVYFDEQLKALLENYRSRPTKDNRNKVKSKFYQLAFQYILGP